MNDKETVTMDRITLEKIKIGLSHCMSSALLDDMTLVLERDIFTDDIIRRFTGYLFANKVNVEDYDDTVRTYPSTMWEELKRDFAPKWFKRLSPIRYSKDITHHTTTHYHVCPHLDVKSNNPHLHFMMLNDTKEAI